MIDTLNNLKIAEDISQGTCRTCQYWCYEDVDQGHVCVNADSYYLAEWTEEDNSCKEYVSVTSKK